MERKIPEWEICSWEKLDSYFRYFFKDHPEWEHNLNANALTDNAIDLLKKEGWKVQRPYHLIKDDPEMEITGMVTMGHPFLKDIDLHPLLAPEDRDLVLFHELCHLHYEEFIWNFLKKNFPIKNPWPIDNMGLRRDISNKKRLEYIDRSQGHLESLIEWLGRKHRQDPSLLRNTVHTFELEPHIYDLPSYLAFSKSYEFAKREIPSEMLDIN